MGQTQFTYDPAGNVSEIKHTNASGTTLLDYQYQWDSADRLSSETDTYSGTPTTTTYGYDASNELTSADRATFTYDANGNRTMAGYQTGADNELLSDGTWNYAYDPAGNMISQVGISNGLAWYYIYDNQNHLLTASEYSGGQLQQQETNSYDVFGNMVEQDETSGGNTVVTKFANRVKNTGGVSQVWADLNSTNQIQTRRVYLDAVDAVCARIASNGTEGWYLTDHLGSIGAIMNNSGTVIDHITYDPWGNPTDSNPSAGDRYKFTGQEYDSVTGQYNYLARVYDAAIGRFTSQDPMGFAAGDADLYRYCGNNPTGETDPAGLQEPISPVGGEIPTAGSIGLKTKPIVVNVRKQPGGSLIGTVTISVVMGKLSTDPGIYFVFVGSGNNNTNDYGWVNHVVQLSGYDPKKPMVLPIAQGSRYDNGNFIPSKQLGAVSQPWEATQPNESSRPVGVSR